MTSPRREPRYSGDSKLWVLGVNALAFLVIGVSGLLWSVDLGEPWRLLVLIGGYLLLALSVWCGIFFVGIEMLIEVSRSKHPERNARMAVWSGIALLFISQIALWYFFVARP